ncbi:hypothetical protein HK414_07635 [Ramlibacter terrae]|uniref:histidine kinase n=1 Tax=Ramlibacter terrae TaxID=2732511 RepID=A0ABX6P434_9BURK|nr:hypothetical protein HK414_07635 [Ramlibacter terrae]
MPLAMPLSQPGGPGPPEIAVALTPVPTLLGVMASARLRDATTVVLVGDDGIVRAAWRSGGGAVSQQEAAQALAFLRTGGERLRIEGEEQLVSLRALPTEPAGGGGVRAARRDDRVPRAPRVLPGGLRRDDRGAARRVPRARAPAGRKHAARPVAQPRAHAAAGAQPAARRQGAAPHAAARTGLPGLESFSYTIAHDVRAPLAAISGFAGELESVVAASGSERHMRYPARIRANAKQMDALTQHLLELGKLTRAPLRLVRVDLSAMAQELLERLRDAEPQRDVEAHVQEGWRPARMPRWCASARQPPGQRMEVHGRPHARAHHLRPARGRAGRGLADLLRQRQRRRLRQHRGGQPVPAVPAHAHRHRISGHRCGLATVQRILALHGGKVWCQAGRAKARPSSSPCANRPPAEPRQRCAFVFLREPSAGSRRRTFPATACSNASQVKRKNP